MELNSDVSIITPGQRHDAGEASGYVLIKIMLGYQIHILSSFKYL